jgi:hypothetical protein
MIIGKNNFMDNPAQISAHISRRALVAGETSPVCGLGCFNRRLAIRSCEQLVRRGVKTAGKVENRIVSFENFERIELPEIDENFMAQRRRIVPAKACSKSRSPLEFA